MKYDFELLESDYLPETQSAYFDGNSVRCSYFMYDFENSITKRVNDDKLNLIYLKYYCGGPAKVAMEGCSIFLLTEGYHLALQNLEKLLGNEHQVSKSLLYSLKK